MSFLNIGLGLFQPPVAVDSTAPVWTVGPTYASNEITGTFEEANQPVALRWATSDTGQSPTYTSGGGWSGTTYETGSITGLTQGAIMETIPISSTTPDGSRKLTLYLEDPSGNVSEIEAPTIPVDNTAPAFSTSSPADGATAVAVDAPLTVTFTDTNAISLGTSKNFYIYEDGVLAETIATSSCSILSGVVTIPHADWTNEATVSVRWDVGAVVDEYGNQVVVNNTDTLVNFDIVSAAGGLTTVGFASANETVDLTTLSSGTLSQDDIVIALPGYSASSSQTITISTSGYTSIVAGVDGSGADAGSEALWKAMGVTPDTNVVFASVDPWVQTIGALVVRGANTSTPLTGTAAAATNTLTPAAITPTVSGSKVFMVAIAGDRDSSPPQTIGTPSNMTLVFSTTAEKNGYSVRVSVFEADWTSGSFQPGDVTFTSEGDGNVLLTFAIQPA